MQKETDVSLSFHPPFLLPFKQLVYSFTLKKNPSPFRSFVRVGVYVCVVRHNFLGRIYEFLSGYCTKNRSPSVIYTYSSSFITTTSFYSNRNPISEIALVYLLSEV